MLTVQRRGRAGAPALLAALIVMALLWGRTAHAQDVMPAATDESHAFILLGPSADTYIYSLKASTNFGAEPDLWIENQSPTAPAPAVQSIWLRFDLARFPAGTTFNRADLTLWQTGFTVAPAWRLPVDRALSAWDEATLTYGTTPDTTSTALVVVSPAAANIAVTTDFSSLVTNWVNFPANFPNYGVQIRGAALAGATRTFSSKEGAVPPTLALDYTLPPIRICLEQIDTCPPAPGAIVALVGGGANRVADENGYVDPTGLRVGQQLWPRWQADNGNGGALFYTAPAPVAAEAINYVGVNGGSELRIAVRSQNPLWVQDLDVSAQWYVQAIPADASALRSRIIAASNYLYSFTDGQFALGSVVVRQRYDGWSGANVQLFTSNTLQPKAIIGGIVGSETPDFAPTVPISYTPGAISIGSYWNRFGSPPNSTNVFEGVTYPEAAMANDWPLALAHELGHYLLFLFDTYTGVDGQSDIALTKTCTGTAMGDVYKPINQNFIFDPTQWAGKCSGTEAYARLNGRTEWQTIAGWHSWVIAPTSVITGPTAPPAPVTTVTFFAPSTPPGAAAAQVFNLDYRDNERSSGEARAFLYQDGRLLEQGKPPKDSVTVQLTGAEVGNRLCVYDINDHAEQGEIPRHQFGCEQIAAGDDTLFMTKQQAWNPVISLRQVGANQVQVVVTETVAGPAADAVRVQFYPEHQTALAAVTLPRTGSVYSATLTLTQTVPPLYAQLYVNEAIAAPATRREVVADRGTGGGGAFGPAKAYGGALVVSSDGNASYESDGPLTLGPGESIAWQSMPGTPPLPFHKWISGQAYRLDAFPASLVQGGFVLINFADRFGLQSAQAPAAQASSSTGGTGQAIYFWDGAGWHALATTVVTPAGATDGTLLGRAPSQGVGVYAVLVDAPPGANTFLPVLRKRGR